jgi:hypothetical protein
MTANDNDSSAYQLQNFQDQEQRDTSFGNMSDSKRKAVT